MVVHLARPQSDGADPGGDAGYRCIVRAGYCDLSVCGKAAGAAHARVAGWEETAKEGRRRAVGR